MINQLTTDIMGQAVDPDSHREQSTIGDNNDWPCQLPRRRARQSQPKAGSRGYQFLTLVAAIFLILTPLFSFAQEAERSDAIPTHKLDSIGTAKDEDAVRIKTYAARFNPQTALLYSAVLPGLGQVYNNSAWKVPFVWGGFVALGYAMKYNQDHYVFYKGLLYRVLNEPNPVVQINKDGDTALGNRVVNGQVIPYPWNFSVATLRQRVSRYQRDRDFTVMLSALWYVLQMVEAHVDAHLKEFKVNPQLQVMVEPAIENNFLTGRTNGLSLKLRF